ncbi:hypothetical protein Tco_0662787 [Tanacetum coccineum]
MKSHEISQRFDETFYEAWDRFNDLLRACPHHGFSKLHQLDTFYNVLNSNDQDSLNSAAGGNFLDKMPRDCLRIIESKSKVRYSEQTDSCRKEYEQSTLYFSRVPNVWKKLSLTELTPTCMTLKLPDRSISQQIGIAEDVYVKTGRALIDVYERELTLRVGKEVCRSITKKFCFSDVIASGNPTPYYDPIVSTSSLTLTPFEDSDFLLEEVDAFLALEDDPTSLEVDHSYYDSEGDIFLLEAFLNDDPSLPLPLKEIICLKFKKNLKFVKLKMINLQL